MENKSFDISSLSENIKFLRKRNKLNQTELANLLNKKTSTISSYEKGETTPPIDVIIDIANVFGVHFSDLITLDFSKITPKSKTKPLIEHDKSKKSINFWIDNKGKMHNIELNEEDKVLRSNTYLTDNEEMDFIKNIVPSEIEEINRKNYHTLVSSISNKYMRIREVYHLITHIADKNNFNIAKIFTSYYSIIEKNNCEELVSRMHQLSSDEMVNEGFVLELNKTVDETLLAIYSDLFNIVNFENFIYTSK